ncbi:CYR1_1 [Sanghuangporus sanghuang]
MSSTTSIHLDPGDRWDYLSPESIPPNVPTTGEDSIVIAPWLEEPPAPPSKGHKHGPALNTKRSVMNFVSARQGSTTSLPRAARGSESICDSISSSGTERQSSTDLRKPKSMNMFNVIKKKVSRIGKDEGSNNGSNGSKDSNTSSANALVPPLPSPLYSQSFLPLQASPAPAPRKHRRRNRPKSPLPPQRPPKEPEFTLDTNLDEMDGIVDMTIRNNDVKGILANDNASASSPGSGFESSYQSSSWSASDGSFHPLAPSPPAQVNTHFQPAFFSNPFLPNATLSASAQAATHRRRGPSHVDPKKICPKTPLPRPPDKKVDGEKRDDEPHSPGWAAPESWAVEREGGLPDVPYTDSDASDSMGAVERSQTVKQQRRRTRNPKRAQSIPHYQIRIHRSDGTYHVVKCPLTTTVSELVPVMNHKLFLDETREPHSLYVKERERERVLAPTEKPADLVRRRLEQAGYDVADGLPLLGADEIGFLIKFIYKSNFLGDQQEEPIVDNNFELIDLTGRSLKTIPILLHANAPKIVFLNLSRNPMLEIPLDFIQSCTTLRELRLSNMAMKKVPQSVRHSASLINLDISCNRIADLDDSGLDRIPSLGTLKAQNNRIDKLPQWFPKLRSLKFLNISNNKFQAVPSVIPEMSNLVDLDISFNMISSLPPEIGSLKSLHSLVMVGNQISKFPPEFSGLVNLVNLDCRRNNISDLSLVSKLPRLEHLLADHNAVHALDLVVGPCMRVLDSSHNDITQLTVLANPSSPSHFRLTSLNISHAKLSSLDDTAFAHLTTLETLHIDHNAFRFIPESLGLLTNLVTFTCSDNQLDMLPMSIGNLQRLVLLDAHNNSLTELPPTMWQCRSLETVNVTSNLISTLHDPPSPTASFDNFDNGESYALAPPMRDVPRKPSTADSVISQSSAMRWLPPLARSLKRLYLGENRLTDDTLHPLSALRELRVLNLSFNNIQELPSSFFRNMVLLEEIYLSGNKLSMIPTEDLHRLTSLTVIFLNGNKLQVLPSELGKLKSLTVLDVGSNVLKYNINNWEFDWNWNFNKALKYLNLSGNKRLKIQPDQSRMSMAHHTASHRKVLADFAELTQLRVLGLMDVTVTSGIPEDDELRRVRTSLSEVNQMPYGIADTLGKKDVLGMLDVVVPDFRGRSDECIFAMFGRFDASHMNNRVSKFLGENFVKVFAQQLEKLDKNAKETVHDAMRRTFLTLNKNMHAFLTASVNLSRKMSAASASTATQATLATDLGILRNGASGIVVYFVGKTIHVANAGDVLAVVSRQGTAQVVSRKHEPFDREETARIRAAEGWVSPKGLVNEEIEVSRSFGFYHLLPAVNPRPDIASYELSELDEFIIIANRGLWDYVSYRTAVDIARSEKDDPMIASQKLRDFAISYGADGSTMIMVICVSALFTARSRQATVGSLADVDAYQARKPKPKTQDIGDVQLSRLPQEVLAPTGHVALVFTDIRNSTHLWDANAGMPTAMRLHNQLLRRQLRLCGGYEVKTEGDAFMCSFPNVLSALKWCLTVQLDLLHESWPLEILECEDGKEIYDKNGRLIERGLSVRMGMHCGTPVCEPDPITHRMDYFGPMVNRSARIVGSANGGQIMCSADVVREIRSQVLNKEYDPADPEQKALVTTIEGIGVEIVPVGERRLKGLEIPEMLSLIYPKELIGRSELILADEPDASGSRVQYSVVQMRELATLCVRLEALTSCRVLRPLPRKGSTASTAGAGGPPVDASSSSSVSLPTEPAEDSVVMYADPMTLIPHISDKAEDRELMAILDSLSMRIENALASLILRRMGDAPQSVLDRLHQGEEVDQRTLIQVLSLLQAALPSLPQLDDS